MDEVENIRGYLKDLVLVMANRAEKEVDAIMPGYTHVQVRRHDAMRPYHYTDSCLLCQ